MNELVEWPCSNHLISLGLSVFVYKLKTLDEEFP